MSPPVVSPVITHERFQANSVSTPSEASVGKPASKPTRPHLVSRQSRNVSHQHGRHANMPPKKSMSQVYNDNNARHHRRAKSGTATPLASPRANAGAQMKRNSSHVVLPKNRSQGNLRKNQSATTLTALNKNMSRGALNKLGAPAEQKSKQAGQQKQGVFDMGADSSEEEEEGEWEDSTASPELTRNNTRNNSATNSKVATPSRPQTPVGEPIPKPPDIQSIIPDERTSSPPEPSVLKGNKSAPDLRYDTTFDRPRQDPALLTSNGRASRAPPAMITANAHSSQMDIHHTGSRHNLNRSEQTSMETSRETINAPPTSRTVTHGGASSSGSAVVSHFLTSEGLSTSSRRERTIPLDNDDDDDDSVCDFMATYKPQVSESPDRSRMTSHPAKLPNQPSRTQQKLELQRREVMRGSTVPSSSSGGLALSVGSSVSLHSRSASKSRPRGVAGEPKAFKQDYESAVRQLVVIRRFRNPIIESVTRIKQQSQIPSSVPISPQKTDQNSKRPSSRRDQTGLPSKRQTTSNETASIHQTPPDGRSLAFRTGEIRSGQGRERVTFQLSRNGSHEDILQTASNAHNTHQDGGNEDTASEDALIRRMWESRIQIHVA